MSLLEAVQTKIQECVSKVPLIVLGSGASAAHGIPGMWPLGRHLSASTLPAACSSELDLAGWHAFLEKLQDEDLESALTGISITPAVLEHIVQTTWNFLNVADLSVFYQVLSDRECLPLSKLFKHLLRSTAADLQVITPNYDRIAEYAAEAAGFCAYTGFTFGTFGERALDVPRIYTGKRASRTVNVWKVHGSFGWFENGNGRVVALPPMREAPSGFTPAIITPGTEKYRRTHEEPFRSTMHSADDAVRRANAFLCIGYGFNDPHLQHLLVERCSRPEVPLVLITKEITKTAHQVLKSGRCKRYIALEESTNGTRLFSSEAPDGLDLEGVAHWKLEEFLSLALS